MNNTMTVTRQDAKEFKTWGSWILESEETHKYYTDAMRLFALKSLPIETPKEVIETILSNLPQIAFVFRSKGKSVVILENGSFLGTRNFSTETPTESAEIIAYLYQTKQDATISLQIANITDKELVLRIWKNYSGSTGKYGSEFLACKSSGKKSNSFTSKVNQKEIANRLEIQLATRENPFLAFSKIADKKEEVKAGKKEEVKAGKK